MSEDAAVILAAGKGTRMRSRLPKVLHPLAGKPMLARVLQALAAAGFPRPTVVVGYGAGEIEAEMGARCVYVRQDEQRGTGHAARVGVAALPASIERVLLVHGDEPLIAADIYRQMLALQGETEAAVVLLTTRVADTRGFGRVIRNAQGTPQALLQEGELTDSQREIDEVNLGAYVFAVPFLRRHLPQLQPHPPKGEYYLTDLIATAAQDGDVAALTVPGGEGLLGINDLVQLEQATSALHQHTNRRLMESGVTILDSASTFVDDEAELAPDTVIHPFTIIEGGTTIGAGCQIGPDARIRDSRIGDRCQIRSSTIEEAVVSDDVTIGPYAHLRPGARVAAGGEIGNYAEIKNASLGAGTRMHHFSYIGDATVGEKVNIGAGTITCNYDGRRKHRTVIEDGAFIGSATLLRAPVTVGRLAVTGAGSVVLHDVPAGSVVAGSPARSLRAAPDHSDEDAIPEKSEAGTAGTGEG